MKKCTKCLIVKEENCFNKNSKEKDGLYYWCKDCKRIWSREYIKRPKPAQYKKDYMKKYRILNADKISKQRAEHRKDPKIIQKELEYRRRPEVISKAIERTKKYNTYPENKIKIMARFILRNRVKSGKIMKSNCAICGNEKVQGHHPDYNKPLCVIWLCAKCHKQEHLRLNKEKLKQTAKIGAHTFFSGK